MSDQQTNKPLWFHWARFSTYITERFLGGPQILKLAWVINFQKTGTFFFILLLMNYYQNFSLSAYVYLALHGMYGFCWMLKHFAFPDKKWEKKVTLGGGLMAFVLVLGPYWVFPFLLISGILGPDQKMASVPVSHCNIATHHGCGNYDECGLPEIFHLEIPPRTYTGRALQIYSPSKLSGRDHALCFLCFDSTTLDTMGHFSLGLDRSFPG